MAAVNVRDRNKGTGRRPNWEYRFEVASENGKRKQISKSGFKTKKEALEAGNKSLVEYNACDSVQINIDITLNECMDEWFNDYCKPKLKYTTLMQYGYQITKYIKPIFGNYKVKDLSPAMMQKFNNHLRSETGLGVAGIQIVIGILQRCLDYAVSPMGYIRDNPARKILDTKPLTKNIESSQEGKEILTPEEFGKIMEAYPMGDDLFLPYFLGWTLGVRIGEVSGLKWSDIDFENGIITVRHQLKSKNDHSYAYADSVTNPEIIRTHSRLYLTAPKYNSIRKITINDDIVAVLQKVKEIQETNKKLYGEKYCRYYLSSETDKNNEKCQRVDTNPPGTEAGFLCVAKRGTIIPENRIGEGLRLARNIVHKEITFHTLRHSHASLLADAGVSLKIIQERLGHKTADITFCTYTHATESARKDLENKLEIFVDNSWTK